MTLSFKKFIYYWMNAAQKKEFPVHFVRFEDVLSNKKATLSGLMELSLSLDSLEELYVKERID